jgi:uncharacterized protein
LKKGNRDCFCFEPNKDLSGLNLFLTRRCNLNCSYCFVDKTKPKDLSSLVLVSAIKFIQQCSQISSKRMHVGYIGGEPLLNWKLFREITIKLQEINQAPEIGFTTNGTLVSQEKVEFIKQRNLRVVLSFDGDITSMDDRRFINGNSSYSAVHKGMELLLSNNVPFLVQLTITPFNVSEFYLNVRHIVSLGITKLIFGFGAELDWNNISLNLLSDNLSKTFQFYKAIYRNHNNVILKYVDDEILSYLLTQTQNERIKQVCPMANEVFAIDVDGKIYPCQAFVNFSEWTIGDVFLGFDARKRRLISSLHNDDLIPCQNCKLLKYCRKCPRNNYVINGSPFLMEGLFCFLGKITYSLVEDFVKTMIKEQNLRFLNEYGELVEQWEIKIN